MKYPLVCIRDIVKIHYGKALKAEDRVKSGFFPVFGSSGQVGCHDQLLVEYPTLIIGRKGSVGQVTYAEQGGWPIDTVFYTELIYKNKVDLRFLFYALKQSHLERWTITTSIPGLNRDDLYNTKIPLPPIEEQRRIAAILDKADAIRRKRKQAIALTEELLRSQFLEMFGDPVTNPKGWEVAELGDLLINIESGWSPKCDSRKAEIDEWGILKLGSVTYGYFNPLENKALLPTDSPRYELEVKPGDLLMTRKNTYDLVGASAFVYETRPKLMMPDLIFRLCLKETVDPVYLWQTLSLNSMRNKLSTLAGGTSGSMPNISKTRLRTLTVPKPPSNLQLRYRKFADVVWKSKNKQKHSLSLQNNLFNSLLQRAFKGEL